MMLRFLCVCINSTKERTKEFRRKKHDFNKVTYCSVAKLKKNILIIKNKFLAQSIA